MNVDWNNNLELLFIEYFRAEPVLWDISSKDYKNKTKQHDAWMRISTIMEIPINELKKKKDSLMSSYRSYKGKVKKSAQSGAGDDDIYQPIWFAYDAMNDFLGDSLTAKKTINTESTKANIEAIENSSQTSRRRKTPSELVEAGAIVKDALATFKSTMQKTQQLVHQEDDCDLYGKLFAKKLRKLSENKKLQLMHDIDGMYLRYQFEDRMTQSPPQFYEPRPGTSSSMHSESPLHYGQANQCTYQNRRLDFDDSVMTQSPSPFNELRPGTSSSTHLKPPIHYGQANQNTQFKKKQVLSAPPSKIVIKAHQLFRLSDYPVHYLENQSSNTSHDNHDQTQDHTES